MVYREYTHRHTVEVCSSVIQWHTHRAMQHCMQQCTTAQYAAIHTVVDSSKFNRARSNHAQCIIVITQCILLAKRTTRYTRHSVVHTADSSTNTQHYTYKSMYVTLYTTHTRRHTARHTTRVHKQTVQTSTCREDTLMCT